MLFDFMGGRTEAQGNDVGSQMQKDFNFNAFSFMNGTNEDKDGSQAIGISAFDFLNGDLGSTSTAASGDAGNKDAFDFFGAGDENSRHSFNFDFFSGIGNSAEKDSNRGASASPGGFNFDF